jgi:hypothetical protein
MTSHEDDSPVEPRVETPVETQVPSDDPSWPAGSHPEWTDRFSDYLDDELPGYERRSIEDHIAGCAACASVLNELRQVVDTAAGMAPLPPGEHVWEAIAAQVREMPRTAQPSAGRRFSFTLPQLAAASVVLALLSGWGALRLVTSTRDPQVASRSAASSSEKIEIVPVGGFEYADPVYDAAVSDLEHALEVGRGRLDPDTVATVQGDLRVIDQALEDARRALLADPSNGYLSDHVADTRQRKLDLLRRATAMTTDSQL